MLQSFFCHQKQGPPQLPSSPLCALLSGPPRSGKTSLLLQFAYNCACQQFSTVVFICKRRNVERKPPLLSQDVDASSDVFERVQMKYVEDDEGIRKYFAAFHLHDNFPRAVIIDDFCDFFDEWKSYGQLRGREISIIKTLALCRDAIDHANKDGVGCKLLISDTHTGQGPRLLYIYQRWLSTIFTIEAIGSSFRLRTYRNGGNQGDKAYAQYSTAQENLTLEVLG